MLVNLGAADVDDVMRYNSVLIQGVATGDVRGEFIGVVR